MSKFSASQMELPWKKERDYAACKLVNAPLMSIAEFNKCFDENPDKLLRFMEVYQDVDYVQDMLARIMKASCT